MKTKRLFCLLLTIMVLAATLVISASASTVLYKGEHDGGTVQWKITSDGTLTVTGNRYIQATTSGDYPWHKYKSKVTKIVVGDNLTDIAKGCFHDMTKVTSVTIGKKVAEIGQGAFSGCTSLKSISIPANVKTLGSGVFSKCSSLKTVTFSKSSKLTEIPGNLFAYSGLETITLPEGITTINTHAFYKCEQLKSITFPQSLTTIRQKAFEECESLTSLTIPANLDNIAIEAFYFCPNLKHLELYRNVNYLDHFRYNDIESVVVRHELDTFTGFDSCKTLKSVTLPDTIKVIGDEAFNFCTALTSIDWPASLTTIGSDAFAGSGLIEAVLPDTVTKVGTGAFRYCKELVTFRANDKITEIPNWFMQDCPKLTELSLGKVKSIGTEAFANCSALLKSELPETLERIADRAFQGCSSLEGIVIPASVKEIDFMAFAQCYAMKAAYFQGSAPAIGAYIFQHCTLDAYYPAGDATWTDEVKKECGGTVTWAESGEANTIPAVSAAPTAFGTVELQWKPIPSTTQYHIYRATKKSGTYKKVATVTDAHHIDSTTKVGSTYYYYVVSESTKGTLSDPSNKVSAKTAKVTPVVTASNVVKTGKIQLTWDAIPGAVKYEIYRATKKDGTYKLMYTAKSNTYTNSSATPSKYYYYQVVAVAADGTTTNPSDIVGRTCDVAQPDINIFNVNKTGKVRITWPKVTGAVEYKVYRSTSKNGPYSLMKTLTNTAYTNTNATVGQGYYYKVVAVAEKSAANSTSDIKFRTVDLPQVQPSITLTSKGKPNVTWEPVEGAVAYKVYRSTDKNRDYTLTYTLTSTNYVNTTAVKDYTYFYKVVAVHSNTAANSAKSEIVSITCKK